MCGGVSAEKTWVVIGKSFYFLGHSSLPVIENFDLDVLQASCCFFDFSAALLLASQD